MFVALAVLIAVIICLVMHSSAKARNDASLSGLKSDGLVGRSSLLDYVLLSAPIRAGSGLPARNSYTCGVLFGVAIACF